MRQKRDPGFTLIELMIVVLIIGIMAAIVYPSYTKHMVQTRRTDAQIALTQAAALQEKYYSDCNYYAQGLTGTRSCGTGVADGTLGASTTSPGGHYTLALAGGTITALTCSAGNFACGFTITATPIGLQVGNGKLRIDSTNTKQWDKKNDNSYGYKWTDR